MSSLFIRNLQLSEMHFPIQLASIENWNPGLYDSDYFFQTDPNGFFIAFFEEQPAGCISAVNYGEEFGFIGLHIIKPEFRCKGIGKVLLTTAIQKLGDRNIGLNCLPDQREYYEKAGFTFAHKILTYMGISSRNFPVSQNISNPYMFSFERLNEFNKKFSPGDRRSFIQFWLNQPKSLLLSIVDENKYCGYGLFRPCQTGYNISPLYCNNYETAQQLLSALIAHMSSDQPFYMNIPKCNTDALKLVEQMEMKIVKETFRMYSRKEPEIQLNNIYSFTSSVLG